MTLICFSSPTQKFPNAENSWMLPWCFATTYLEVWSLTKSEVLSYCNCCNIWNFSTVKSHCKFTVQVNSEEARSFIADQGKKYIHAAALSSFLKSLRMEINRTNLWELPRTCLRWWWVLLSRTGKQGTMSWHQSLIFIIKYNCSTAFCCFITKGVDVLPYSIFTSR